MNAVDNENLMLWIVAIVAVVGIVAMALAAERYNSEPTFKPIM